jgi:hypothetical protein
MPEQHPPRLEVADGNDQLDPNRSTTATTWSIDDARQAALAQSRQLRNDAQAHAPSGKQPEPVQPRAELRLAVTCPGCGGPFHIVAPGRPLYGGTELRYVVACAACRRHWTLAVILADVTHELSRPQAVDGVPHGTYACYAARGCRRPECTDAAAAYQRERRARQRADRGAA